MHLNEYQTYLRRIKKTNSSSNDSSDSPVTSKQASEESIEEKQITLSKVFKRAAPLPSNSPRCSSLFHTTMNFVFQTLQPLSIVDEPAFRNLL